MFVAPRQLRPATPGDAADIHRMIVELAEYERSADRVEVTPAQLAEQLRADPPPFECLLCEVDGRTVGFALFFPNYSTWTGKPGVWLEDLYVEPAHRGRGHGRALLQELARLTVDRGGARLEWPVLDWNQPAVDFYRALGTVPMDEWTTWRLHGDALANLAGETR